MNSSLILASGSPRRKELLFSLGVPFTIVIPNIDESVATEETGADAALRLARAKGERMASVEPQAWILSADTIVECEGQTLGKPRDVKEAFVMLTLLSGRTHTVYGGISLVNTEKNVREYTCSETNVTFGPLSRKEITDYIATGAPMDKAGAYGIQDDAAKFVRSISGSYTNIVGLDLHWCYEAFKRNGLADWDEN